MRCCGCPSLAAATAAAVLLRNCNNVAVVRVAAVVDVAMLLLFIMVHVAKQGVNSRYNG